MAIRVHTRFKGGSRAILLYYIDPDTGREVSKSSGTRDLRAADRAAALWYYLAKARRSCCPP